MKEGWGEDERDGHVSGKTRQWSVALGAESRVFKSRDLQIPTHFNTVSVHNLSRLLDNLLENIHPIPFARSSPEIFNDGMKSHRLVPGRRK